MWKNMENHRKPLKFVPLSRTGNGYIKTSDLKDILRALDDKLTNNELDEMIAEIDTDGSGTVDFDGECVGKPFKFLTKKLLDHFKNSSIMTNNLLPSRRRILGDDDWRLSARPASSTTQFLSFSSFRPDYFC